MATLLRALALKHRASLGDEVEEVSFEAGAEFVALERWQNHVLVRDAEDRLYNVALDDIELAPGEAAQREQEKR